MPSELIFLFGSRELLAAVESVTLVASLSCLEPEVAAFAGVPLVDVLTGDVVGEVVGEVVGAAVTALLGPMLADGAVTVDVLVMAAIDIGLTLSYL